MAFSCFLSLATPCSTPPLRSSTLTSKHPHRNAHPVNGLTIHNPPCTPHLATPSQRSRKPAFDAISQRAIAPPYLPSPFSALRSDKLPERQVSRAPLGALPSVVERERERERAEGGGSEMGRGGCPRCCEVAGVG